jgi:hypothetical protein
MLTGLLQNYERFISDYFIQFLLHINMFKKEFLMIFLVRIIFFNDPSSSNQI